MLGKKLVRIANHLAYGKLPAPTVVLVVDAPQGRGEVEHVEGEVEVKVLLAEGGQLVLAGRDEEEGGSVTKETLCVHPV